MDRIFQTANRDDYLDKLIDDLANRRTDPYSAASNIINRAIQEGKFF